ncbi:MAG: BrnA antitoxin family protein, partial [Thiotrichales bacterium]|nr:BrnA antitoxin family protein [Thiotrichales bacterium]
RPKSLSPKKSATLRYDQEILDFFKATGKGWQTRINDVLLEYVHSH